MRCPGTCAKSDMGTSANRSSRANSVQRSCRGRGLTTLLRDRLLRDRLLRDGLLRDRLLRDRLLRDGFLRDGFLRDRLAGTRDELCCGLQLLREILGWGQFAQAGYVDEFALAA